MTLSPGSFPGFLSSTKPHPRASATGAPMMKPRASKPAAHEGMIKQAAPVGNSLYR